MQGLAELQSGIVPYFYTIIIEVRCVEIIISETLQHIIDNVMGVRVAQCLHEVPLTLDNVLFIGIGV